ncbi:MAG TPA: 6,7-dimethyl-8-ribityllumazine synthase [Candidatus Saccharimonadales bacterium]|nr:6,7-dimethyl-8-ribityllumazine synthase [Candidatus Saccharimonadales bacterium]
MIKEITTTRQVKSVKEYGALAALFTALGMERGKEWKTPNGRGLPFEISGKLEFIQGRQSVPADVWIRVTDLDTVRGLLKKHKTRIVADISESGWNSRILVIEPVKSMRFALWQEDHPREDADEGDLNAAGMKFAIVVSRWNSFITERLLQGAVDALRRSGCRKQDFTVVRVPGAFEIPSQARTLAATHKYDAIITLGCLIRGETDHYEHISTEVTRGIGQSAQETGVPHTYGVLTCETLEQALDRAGLKAGNKGHEAAISAVEMVSLKRKTGGPPPRAKSRAR